MEAPKPAQLTAAQPQQSIQMNAMNPTAPVNTQQQHVEHQHKAHRVRGGGAGRDCFLGLIECFICFECCKVTAASAALTLFAALARCAAKRIGCNHWVVVVKPYLPELLNDCCANTTTMMTMKMTMLFLYCNPRPV
ncbi:hypothetical protein BC834DRAFT_581893 [Gloeopeniophorella convolvens]|nr:hypothetical protein BC834DRAFT_581893 [Gloeopeniophorella convolvens]